jgi:hypothetical protein
MPCENRAVQVRITLEYFGSRHKQSSSGEHNIRIFQIKAKKEQFRSGLKPQKFRVGKKN